MNNTRVPGNPSFEKTKAAITGKLPALCLAVLFTVVAAAAASAFGTYTTWFNTEYGTAGTSGGSTLGSCITCHVNSNGTGGLNPYALDWKAAGANAAAFGAIENQDSDGDGYVNLDEILVDTFPGNPASRPAPVNDPPAADAGSDQTVGEGATVTLDASGSSDPDDGIASYQWEQTVGPHVALSDPTAAQPTFSAPGFQSGANTLTFSLTVTDNGGLFASDTVTITVTDVNQPPVADAGADQTVLQVGLTVTLDGSNSSDPDDGIAVYFWQQTAGPSVSLSDDSAVRPTFVSPEAAAGGITLAFSLTVTDTFGYQDIDSCVVVVTVDNLPPTAAAGVDQTVTEGEVLSLDATGSEDPDGTIVSYGWHQTAGPAVSLSAANVAQPTFSAPDVGSQGESLTFKLTVTDDQGLQDTDEVIITVSWLNEPPVSEAGSDQTVTEGQTVTLDGSASSDSDGGIAGYTWTQTGPGTAVALSDPTGAQPVFVAPAVGLSGEILTFELTVEDPFGLHSSDTVTITISDNGISGFPDEAITCSSEEGDPIGITEDSGGRLAQLEMVDPTTIVETVGKPRDFPMGMIDFQAKADTIGGTVILTVHLAEPAPEHYHWYKYDAGGDGWINYDEATGANGELGAVFNNARDQVTITLIDGGMGDDDGVANGMIVDPSGLATVFPALVETGSAGSNDFGTSGAGCFVTATADGNLTKHPGKAILFALAGMILLVSLVLAVRLNK